MSKYHDDAIRLSRAIHAAHISASSYRAPALAQEALAKAWEAGYDVGEDDRCIAERGLGDEWDDYVGRDGNPYRQEQS